MSDPYCPQCGAPMKQSARFCARCGTQAQPFAPPTHVGAQAVPPMQDGARASLMIAALKGAALGLAAELALALLIGFLSPTSLAAGSHKTTGYEAGVQGRHVFQALGAWPSIIGAVVATIRVRRKRLR